MKKTFFVIALFFWIPILCGGQTLSFWSKDSLEFKKTQREHSNQYTTPLFGGAYDYYNPDSTRKSNSWEGIISWVVKDFNNDGYADIFGGHITSENESLPFKLLFYDSITGKYANKSHLIKNNIGQKFNRKSMSADLNGDNIPDMVAVSHPECLSCSLSSFDIIFSDSSTKTWFQKTLKTPNRFKGEGYFHGVALGDINNDGSIDIVLANENTDFGGNITMLNDGKGNFTEQFSMNFFDKKTSRFGISWTIELADLNNDSFLDLMYTHDSTYRGIAYGDGSGKFGDKIEQRFPLTKYSATYDYDAYDIDKDGDLDLIVTTTGQNSWELVFYENQGNDRYGKIIWKNRTDDVNATLIKNGFYSDRLTDVVPVYISLLDLNKDGYIDIIPQWPLNNYTQNWILYGQKNWLFSYKKNMIPEVPDKPSISLERNGKVKIKWKRVTIKTDKSNQNISSWNLYFSNKLFGDKSMTKFGPIKVDSSNSFTLNDSINFTCNLPFDTTFLRLTAVDDNSLETPLSELTSYICKLPAPPTVLNPTLCADQSPFNLTDYVKSDYNLQWYDSEDSKIPNTNVPKLGNQVGVYSFYVSSLNKCESPSKSILNIKIEKTPDPPIILRDSLNNLASNTTATIWYRDGIQLADTISKIRPMSNGYYTAQTIHNGCLSKISSPYYYFISSLILLQSGEYINFYPNPTTDFLKIDYRLYGNQELNVFLFDAFGRQVLSKTINGSSYVDIRNLAKGNYSLIVKNRLGKFVYSKIIQKY